MQKSHGLSWALSALVALAAAQTAHAVSATGGNATETVGSYRIHTFTSGGTFVVTSGGNVDVMVIGGGGAGGNHAGGGGGAGGLIYYGPETPSGGHPGGTSYAITNGTYTVTVGAGGTWTSTYKANGTDGGNSVFGSLTAFGGGRGGARDATVGAGTGNTGGSGGGGGCHSGGNVGGVAIATTPLQGYKGGNAGANSGSYAGSGGGGAGGAGATAASGIAGRGAGLTYSISGTPTTYATGGGGAYNWATPGYAAVIPGTGNGGDAASYGSGPGTNGHGAAGIVIVRYLAGSVPGAPVIANAAVSNLTFGAAFFNASIQSTGSAPVTAVSVYWGPSNAGTNASLWANTNAIAGTIWNLGDAVTTNIGGLLPNTTHYYTFAANNSFGTTFAEPSISFLSLGAPSVSNAGVLSNTVQRATLLGQVTAGNPTPQVYVCWGTNDAGTSATSAWQNVAGGATASGTFAVIATNLTTVGPYYYRCYATNAVGDGWAPTAGKFTEGQRVALMAAWKIPTNGINNNNLDTTFRIASTNGTLVIYSNAQVDAHLSSANAWYNYGTYGAGVNSSGPGLFGFAVTNLPRFAGATINRAQFLVVQNNGNNPGTGGNRWMDHVVTRAWSVGNKNGAYPGSTNTSPAARGVSWAHPSGINSNANQNADGGTTQPLRSWGRAGTNVFTWGADTSGTPRSPADAGSGDPHALVYSVTDIVGGWSLGSLSNFGFCLKWDFPNNNFSFNYSEYDAQGVREPVLFIDYTPAPDSPVISNYGGATNVAFTTATLQGLLSSTGSAPTEVRVYYGRQDKYPSTNDWDGVAYIGNPQGIGLFATNVTGLLDGTGYVYRCYATNSFGDAWATQATAFATIPLSVAVNNNGGATGITSYAAWLNGSLVSTGSAPTAVWVFLGTNGATGGPSNTDKSQWMTNFFVGSNIPLATYMTVRATGLQPATAYSYSYYASNTAGAEAWASVSNFTPFAQVDYVAKADAAWNSASTWDPSTGYPQNPNDTATILSNTVAAGSYIVPMIELVNVTTNATGSATGTLTFAASQTVPLQLNGGVLSPAANNLTWSGRLTLKAASLISEGGNVLTLSGGIQDWVQDGVTNTGQIAVPGSGRVDLSATSTGFSGGWSVTAGMLRELAGGALGSGDVTIRNSSLVLESSGDTNLPNITVGSGGSLHLAGNNYHNSAGSGKTISLLNGSDFGWGWGLSYDGGSFLDGAIQVSGNVSLSGSSVHGANLYLTGDILNSGAATINVVATIGPHLQRANNAYTGNWIMAAGASLQAEASGAMGTGTVDLPATNSTLNISGGLTLNNMFTGNGAFGGVTLQPTYRNATLADAGVSPGTNATFVIGVLTNSGNLAFTNLPNYDGNGNTAYCKVKIAMVRNPFTDLGQASQLNVGGNLTGLANADLLVNAGPRMPVGTYTIITAANNLSSLQFHSVSFSGTAGRVLYNNGSVQVQIIPSGTVLILQ